MAALWLQSVSLLVLLIISWPCSLAAPSGQKMCGAHLVEALQLVCGERGFLYNPKRSVNPLLGGAAAGGEKTEAEFTSGIVEQCCFKSCNIFDLENYCN